jgi:hypothetical protein
LSVEDVSGGRKPGFLGQAGGLGALPVGGSGAEFRELSESDRYDESGLAPVSMPPPRFLSFGIPPANMAPSWGADGTTPESSPSGLPRPPSLLLRSLFPAPPGRGGAPPPGRLGMLGIGGAPPSDGPLDAPGSLVINGADLSFVTVFLRWAPFAISPRRAP